MNSSATEKDEEDEARLPDNILASSEAQTLPAEEKKLPESFSEDIRPFERKISCPITAVPTTSPGIDCFSPSARTGRSGTPDSSLGIVVLPAFAPQRDHPSYAVASTHPSAMEVDEDDEDVHEDDEEVDGEDKRTLPESIFASSEAQTLPEPSNEDIRPFERTVPCRNTAVVSTRSDFERLSFSDPACIGAPDSSLGKVAPRAFNPWRCRPSSAAASTCPSTIEADKEDEAQLAFRSAARVRDEEKF